MKNVKTLLIGASFFAVGYASAHSDCLIAERRETVGFDFVGCADISPVDTEKSYSEPASELLRELIARGLADSSGKVSIYPVSSVLSKYILEKDINLLLSTETVSVERRENGFEVTLFGARGYETVFAERVIDTRAVSPYGEKVGYKKLLNVSLIGDGAEFAGEDDFVLKNGLYGTSVLGMRLSPETDYPAARRLFSERAEKLIKNSRIAAFALDFKYEFSDKNICRLSDNGVYWVPSASYNSFLDAFEEGYLCGI